MYQYIGWCSVHMINPSFPWNFGQFLRVFFMIKGWSCLSRLVRKANFVMSHVLIDISGYSKEKKHSQNGSLKSRTCSGSVIILAYQIILSGTIPTNNFYQRKFSH